MKSFIQWCSQGVFFFKGEAGVKAVKAGNEARQDWGRGSHPKAKARQTETEV